MSALERNNKRTIFGWAMYDWANSAYITAGSLIFSIYFAGEVFPEEGIEFLGWTLDGDGFWALIVGFGAFAVFIVMPILGAAADFSDAKLRMLKWFAYTGAFFTVLLVFVGPGAVALGIGLFLLTRFGFVAGNVMYDGFLPEITSDDTVDSVSAKGFALGYAGGGLHLLLGAAFIFMHESIGISENTATVIVVGSAGMWWAAFGAFAFSRLRDGGRGQQLPERYRSTNRLFAYAGLGFSRTWATTKHLLAFKPLLLFVIAFIIYNDGVATVIAITGVYASEVLELEQTTILLAFLVTQVVAVIGALLFGRIAKAIGAKGALLISISVWAFVALGAYFLPTGSAAPFFAVATVAGLVLGGIQALSRSLYATMIPEEASAEFFGFFSVFSKFSAIWGPLIFFIVDTTTGSARTAILSFIGFFVVGGILLSRVDVDQARADRERWRFEGGEAGVSVGSER